MRHHRRTRGLLFLTFEYTFSVHKITNVVRNGRLQSLVFPCEGLLTVAIARKRVDIIETVISLGVNPNEKIHYSNTPIILHACHSEPIVITLLKSGASGLVLLEHDHIIQLMCRQWNDRTITLLFDSIPKSSTIQKLDFILKTVSRFGRLRFIQLLLDRGATVTSDAIRNAHKAGHTGIADYLEFIACH